MLKKFLNKYRTSSARLQNWDYGSSAPYFITICTAHKELFFGTIRNGEMHFTEIGEIVVDEWLKTPVIRPDMNIFLDEFVVMPDHFHGIVIIGNNRFNNRLINVGRNAMHVGRNAMHGVSTDTDTNTDTNTDTDTNTKNKFGPQVKNLSSIVRGFKSAVTVRARRIDGDFAWQPRFYDSIIRDDRSFQRIKKYIINNPKKWKVDD